MIYYSAIVPPHIKDKEFRLELLNGLRRAGSAIRKDYQATTKTWRHKVTFTFQISLVGGAGLEVATDDKIYRFVNDGTARHRILAGKWSGKNNNSLLKFSRDFTPKTTPRVIGSQVGSRGGPIIKRMGVWNSIYERMFEQIIKEKWEPEFAERMQAAMDRGAVKSGHFI